MVYTSYYGNIDKLLSSGFDKSDLIGISVYPCKSVSGVKYDERFFPNIGLLWNLKSGVIDFDEYRLEYWKKLYHLSGKNFVNWLNFDVEFDGKIFLCFEKNYKCCHRYLLGKFVNWFLGKTVVTEF